MDGPTVGIARGRMEELAYRGHARQLEKLERLKRALSKNFYLRDIASTRSTGESSASHIHSMTRGSSEKAGLRLIQTR